MLRPLTYGQSVLWDDEEKIYGRSPVDRNYPSIMDRIPTDTDSFGYPLDYNTGPMGQVRNMAQDAAIRTRQMNRNAGMDDQTFVDPSKVNAEYYANLFKPYSTADREAIKNQPLNVFGQTMTLDGKPITAGQDLTLGDAYKASKENIGKIPYYGAMANTVEELVNPIPNVPDLLNAIGDAEVAKELGDWIAQNPKEATVAGISAWFAAKSKPVRALWNKIANRYKGPSLVRNNKTTGKLEKVPGSGKLKGSKIAADATKVIIGANAAYEVAKEKQGKDNLFNVGATEGAYSDDKSYGGADEFAEESLMKTPKDVKDNVGKANALKETNPGFFDSLLQTVPGGGGGAWDTRLYRLGELMNWMGTPIAKRGKNPAERWQRITEKSIEQENKLAMKGLELKAKEKGYNWKAKEIADYASNYFDSYFGTDFPIFGKDKDIERNRFITAVADTKKLPGNENVPLQKIIDEVLKKGNFK